MRRKPDPEALMRRLGANGREIRRNIHLMIMDGRLPGPVSRERELKERLSIRLDKELLSACDRKDVAPAEIKDLLGQGADPKAKGPDGSVAEVLLKTYFRELCRDPEREQDEIIECKRMLARAGADFSVETDMDPVKTGIDGLLVEHVRGVCEGRVAADDDLILDLILRGADPYAKIEGKAINDYVDDVLEAMASKIATRGLTADIEARIKDVFKLQVLIV